MKSGQASVRSRGYWSLLAAMTCAMAGAASVAHAEPPAADAPAPAATPASKAPAASEPAPTKPAANPPEPKSKPPAAKAESAKADAPKADTAAPASTDAAAEAASEDAGPPSAYAAPELKVVARAPFGAASGQAGKIPSLPAREERGNVIIQILLGLTLTAVVVTLMTAARLSRLQRADGRTERALTVGVKVVLATGGLTTLLVGVGTVAAHGTMQFARAQDRVSTLGERARLVHGFAGDIEQFRLALREFTQDNSEANYRAMNNTLATMRARVDASAKTMSAGEEGRLVGQLSGALAQLEQAAGEVVALHDERVGTFQSQTYTTAVHISELLARLGTEVKSREGAAGALELALANATYQQARIGLFKFLRTDQPADMQEAIDLIANSRTALDRAGARVKAPEFKQSLQEATDALAFWHTRLERLLELTSQRDQGLRDNVTPAADAFAQAAQQLDDAFAKQTVAAQEDINAAIAATMYKTAGILLGGVLLAAFASLALVRSFRVGIVPVMTSLRRVSAGDLTVQPINSTAHDELGEVSRLTDSAVAALRDVLGEVSTSSQDVSAAATEIAASAEEMSSNVGEVARQASLASEAAGAAGNTATSGGQIIGQTVSSMRSIHESVSETSRSIQELGKRSAEIGRIIEVINDIADQTNLLALNAAIEAARAGEHGRGFAVVADEVRKLAERTTKATEEVATSIRAIQQGTEQAVQVMARGSTLVDTGVGHADKAKANLETIVSGAGEVASMIKAIHAAGEEAGAGASQSAAAAQQLSARAEQLRTMVQRFKIRG